MFLLIPTQQTKDANDTNVFTFHNVSINSVLRHAQVSTLHTFTFHNVSINSTWINKENAAHVRINATYIYIPQCFY